MIIFPAIDLKDGKCVRLYKGDFNKTTIFNSSPYNQALLLLGIFVNLEMLSTLRRAPPDGSRFFGYQCKSLAHESSLVRHKVHKAQKRTPCADMEKAVKVYSVDDNRASSLQPSRIVEFPLSGTMITHNTHNTHDTTPNP